MHQFIQLSKRILPLLLSLRPCARLIKHHTQQQATTRAWTAKLSGFASEFIPQTVQGNQTIQSGKRASVGPGTNTEKKKEKKTDIHSGKCGKVQPFHPTLAKERGVGEEKASSTLTSQQYEIRSQFWSQISSGRDWDKWKMREGSQETLTTKMITGATNPTWDQATFPRDDNKLANCMASSVRLVLSCD